MAVVDGVIYQDITKIIERGKKLGILKNNEKPSIADILYIDLVWRTLNLSHDLDTDTNEFEITHRKMLQYGNLNKILATYEQINNRKKDKDVEEGVFAKVVKKLAAESKKEDEKRKRKFELIAQKVARGETLTDEEQVLFDAGCEAGMEAEA